ncbi:MAG TPA: class I SAM-dependent DNA methyltransferase, partial [Acidobacteriota bacterium]|nr:class I SAM-dependent DNA methyltransferase [Acidobacteriota bacterium]
MPDHNYFANLIWQIADLLRGPYRPPQYERVMLPMTVLRRFDCVLAPTKAAVLRKHEQVKDKYKDEALDKVLDKAAGQRFHNHSPLDFEKLKGDPDNIEKHLVSYIKGFSANVRTIFDFFEFENEIEKMREANMLYLVVSKFCYVDLHPSAVPNEQMGLIFENLIRRFNELANETAGDHFTPREVIRLMVNILFINDDKLLATPGTVRKLLDPACGTGGMLAESQNYLREHHPAARLYVYGQDYNKRAFATAASDMLMKQVDHNGGGDNVRFGDSFTDDQFAGETFDYLLTNPPFGVDWKKQQKEIEREHDKVGFAGRFGAGLPRVNDGSLLFLQHMINKFEPVLPDRQKHGSRLAIVFSGSPLFTGGAGSGESDIRKWIIENDWLEAIIALPEQMFYNTGIGTYVWIVTNRKEKRRKGKIQLIDARGYYVPMRRSLGDKRRKIGEKEDGRDQMTEIVQLYGRFADGDKSKVFDNADFGYTRVTVERPLRLRHQMTVEDKARFLDACPHLLDDVQDIDKALGREPRRDWNAVWAQIEDLLHERKSPWKSSEQKLFRSVFAQKDPNAEPVLAIRNPKSTIRNSYEPDPDLRDFENVSLKEDIDAYFDREVRPHVPDAWMDRSKDKVG